MFNFDRHDHIWHLYTPEAIREQANDGRLMHVPADAGVTLIQGQFISLGAYGYDPAYSFRIAQEERRSQMEAQERVCCASVVREARPGQLKVLQAFSKGLRPQQVAQELDIGLTTVHSHRAPRLPFPANKVRRLLRYT